MLLRVTIRYMEQRLTLYRRHTALCLHEYPTDDRIYDPESDRHDANRPDCNCPIVVSGKLKNEEGRILHRSTGTKDWNEARRCRELWLSWGQSTAPDSPLANLNPNTVTIGEAIQFFLDLYRTFRSSTRPLAFPYQKRRCHRRGIRLERKGIFG